MSMTVLVVGVAAQVVLAFMQFMLVVFSAAGTMNTRDLSRGHTNILNTCMWLLPGISGATAALLIMGYRLRASWLSNAWHLVPVGCLALYLVYVARLGKQPRSRSS
ncbi:hypothetical protein A176_007021 [Myxococcus hansupus]|uniref:Uncharacterized protein n=1 Tax=Pseudomyxococcus hansupus TaxID=1297742 RepID=A0A0H4X4H5_9BACT|nr:hypothetical protein [Myxococcus hansupus]AKQ70109.1 hypothetical protein A176_007021 [Myxococcus hansupus]